jgi:superoxide reductase
MANPSETIKKADWKTEKHVPVIELPAKIAAGQEFKVTVSVGKEIAHPNTIEHHITWIAVFFQPEGAPVPFQVGHCEFTGHGPVFTAPSCTVTMTTDRPGTVQALSFCNIHGMWENSAPVSFG